MKVEKPCPSGDIIIIPTAYLVDVKLDESERKLLILVLQLQIQAVAVLRFAAGDNPSPSIIRPEAC